MKWEIEALKILARNPSVPSVALLDTISEIEALTDRLAKTHATLAKVKAALADSERRNQEEHHAYVVMTKANDRHREYIAELEAARDSACAWEYDDIDSYWKSACGLIWVMDDMPVENQMNFCPKCGKKLWVSTVAAPEVE